MASDGGRYDVLCAPPDVWEHVASLLRSPRDLRSLACVAGALSAACGRPLARLRRRRLTRRALSRWMRYPGVRAAADAASYRAAVQLPVHVTDRLRELEVPAVVQRTMVTDMYYVARYANHAIDELVRWSDMMFEMLKALGMPEPPRLAHEGCPPWFCRFWKDACVRLRLRTCLVVLPGARADGAAR